MKCPRDGTVLAGVRVGSVKFEKCHHCDGLWFDQGELDAIRKAKLTSVEEKIENEYGNPEYEMRETDGYMQCPRCDGRLRRVYDTHRTALEIDRCSDCNGVWLDDGELDKMTGGRKPSEKTTASGRTFAILRSVMSWIDKA